VWAQVARPKSFNNLRLRDRSGSASSSARLQSEVSQLFEIDDLNSVSWIEGQRVLLERFLDISR